jgi:hypothetical protein
MEQEILKEMRHPYIENEYVFMEKKLYFQNHNQVVMAHLPYFSNCRGFGRTIPLW